MRAIVCAPIFPACGGARPHAGVELGCCAEHLLTQCGSNLHSAVPTVAIYCGLSFTLLYIFDCSENATAELGRNARYQAHPASIPNTGHRAVSFFQLTDVQLVVTKIAE